MKYCLIACRSLTYAQRAGAVLERAGITSRLIRTPRSISEEGCGYSVKISEQKLKDALDAIGRAEVSILRVYEENGDGSYREANL
jgi:hypothetical protein